jgi:hypothetical protein
MADDFLASLLGAAFLVTSSKVQLVHPGEPPPPPTDLSTESFIQTIKERSGSSGSGSSANMSELEAGFKKAQDNRMSWDQVTFTDATGGLQYVRTLKVAAMVGDVKATSFLIEHDSQRHDDVLLGAMETGMNEVVEEVLGHKSLKVDPACGYALLFFEAAQRLNNANFFHKLLRVPQSKGQLRTLCDAPHFEPDTFHRCARARHSLLCAARR